MKFLLSVFTVLLLAACNSTPEPTATAEVDTTNPAKVATVLPDIDAHTESEALDLILREGVGMKVKRMMCIAKLPAQEQALNVSFASWFERNDAELNAARKYSAGLEDTEYQRVKQESIAILLGLFEEQGDASTTTYCTNIQSWIVAGRLDFSRTAPSASLLAAGYLAANPLTSVESAQLHLAKECTSRAVAQSTDLGLANLMCDCMAGEVVKVAKDPAALDMDGDLMTQLPSAEIQKAVADKTEQCVISKRFDDDLRL